MTTRSDTAQQIRDLADRVEGQAGADAVAAADLREADALLSTAADELADAADALGEMTILGWIEDGRASGDGSAGVVAAHGLMHLDPRGWPPDAQTLPPLLRLMADRLDSHHQLIEQRDRPRAMQGPGEVAGELRRLAHRVEHRRPVPRLEARGELTRQESIALAAALELDPIEVYLADQLLWAAHADCGAFASEPYARRAIAQCRGLGPWETAGVAVAALEWGAVVHSDELTDGDGGWVLDRETLPRLLRLVADRLGVGKGPKPLTETARRAADYIRAHPGQNQKQVAAGIDHDYSAFRRDIRPQLEAHGYTVTPSMHPPTV